MCLQVSAVGLGIVEVEYCFCEEETFGLVRTCFNMTLEVEALRKKQATFGNYPMSV